MRIVFLGLLLVLSACDDRAQPFTLYRNSGVDPTLRIHFATFNANESARDYNLTNCQMASRLLNANIEELAKAENRKSPAGVGFWCEPGTFKSSGRVPLSFDAKYPTDADN